jgi:signal peptidase II
MLKNNFNKILLNLIVVIFIFAFYRLSKLYILNLLEREQVVNVYINQFMNLNLIWNTGIGFGLLSSDSNFYYNLVTFLIIIINVIILIMIFKSDNYKFFLLLMILGGSLGNLFDRIWYNAVPDFIDLHYNNFHWFIFNVADIFITIGILCLIFAELFLNNKKTN